MVAAVRQDITFSSSLGWTEIIITTLLKDSYKRLSFLTFHKSRLEKLLSSDRQSFVK